MSRPGSRCELFERLGLQLLIVTPLQKIHVIEPHVSAVGFVDNPTSRYSRLRTLTIEEYQAERVARALGVAGRGGGGLTWGGPPRTGRGPARRTCARPCAGSGPSC